MSDSVDNVKTPGNVGVEEYDYDKDSDEAYAFVLATVSEAIDSIATAPGNFGPCARQIRDILRNCSDVSTYQNVVEILVEKGVSNINFCYSGARLAVDMMESVGADRALFLSILLTRCQHVFKVCVEGMKKDQILSPRCQGVLMFFAELFMNLKLKVTNPANQVCQWESDGVRITILGLGMVEIMQEMIKRRSFDDVQNVFKTLKLVGWDLDNIEEAKMKSEFGKLMEALKWLVQDPGVESRTKGTIEVLLAMKDNKWNRGDNATVVPPPLVEDQNLNDSLDMNEDIGDGVDPPPDCLYELPESEDESDIDDCILLDNEPQEVQIAYDEFLKHTPPSEPIFTSDITDKGDA